MEVYYQLPTVAIRSGPLTACSHNDRKHPVLIHIFLAGGGAYWAADSFHSNRTDMASNFVCALSRLLTSVWQAH